MELYDYGARYYASWIARFVSVDPLQHDYPIYTPYQYAGNKPISYIDLDGLEEFSVTIKITDNNRITTVRLLQNTDNKIESIKKAKVTYITNDSTYVMHGFKRKKEEAIADTIYQSYMNPKYYEENGKQVKEYLTGKRFEEKIKAQQPKPDPVKLDTEIPLNITFQGSSSEFLNEEDSLEAIEKLTKTLQNNQNIEAIVTVGTNLPEDDPNSSGYVRSRMMKISSEIMKSAGGFTSGAKLDFRFVPDYGKAQRTTVKYKTKDKNK